MINVARVPKNRNLYGGLEDCITSLKSSKEPLCNGPYHVG